MLLQSARGAAAVGGLSMLRWAFEATPAAGAPRVRTARVAERLGAYCGCVAMENAAAFERYLGRPLALIHDFLPTAEDWSRLHSQYYAFGQHWTRPGSPYADRLYLSIPMLVERDTAAVDGPGGRTTLARAAAGRYDEHYAALGRQLVFVGLGHVRVRVGWEMNNLPGPNGPTMDWSAGNSADGERQFVQAYRRVVRAMRSAPGQSFRFVWCPAIGSSWSTVLGRFIDPERCYPGDDYVSIIACDVYDRRWVGNTTAAARWDDLETGRYGNTYCLRWFERFTTPGYVRQNNDGRDGVGKGHAAPGRAKPLGLGEFGTFRLPRERPGQRDGGDNPYFLYRLIDWMERVGAHRWDHLNYWNFGAGGQITPVSYYPRWDKAVRQLFGERAASLRLA